MPKMIRRKPHLEVLEALTAAGFNPFLARIVAGRIKPGQTFDGVNFLGPKLQVLDHPRSIKDIDKAVSRLVAAIANQEIIAIETDHDCDGQTAHAVMHTALIEIFGVPASKVQSFIGHRMKEGYGLSDAVATRILNAIPRPNVVITADNGSSDEPRIARLKEAGIDVIVTDHHHLPEEGPPKSAYACLNPTREDCDFPDDSIAGCMVAWLLMSALRQALIEAGLLSEKAPSLKGLLDYVAVGTVADCVSLSRSLNNRAVIRAGLQLISQMQRPCWQAILPLLKRPFLRAEDLGFTIGPMLNSDGRLSDAFGSVSFLLSKDLNEAGPWAQQLYRQNEIRKGIQKRITETAMKLAERQVAEGRVSLAIFLEDGHAGVHGISASRIKDAFGRPVILFSPKEGEDDVLAGSARSIESVNIRQAIAEAAELAPGVVLKFGGHVGAAGLSIVKAQLSAFQDAFEKAVLKQISQEQVGPVCLSDGVLPEEYLSLSFLDSIFTLEPFGREFEEPLFEGVFTVASVKTMGEHGQHLSLQVRTEQNRLLRAVWFGADSTGLALKPGDRIQALFSLTDNHFNGTRLLQLMIKNLERVSVFENQLAAAEVLLSGRG